MNLLQDLKTLDATPPAASVADGKSAFDKMKQLLMPMVGRDDIIRAIGFVSNAGSPVGSVVPQFTGQLCFDSTNSAYYRATGSSANTQWVRLSADFATGNFTVTGLLFESTANALTAGATQTQAGALALTKELNRITTVATSGDGVALPAAVAGLTIIVINKGANPLAVYPINGGTDQIDGQTANTSVLQMQSSMVIYSCAVTGQWDSEGLATGYSGSYQTLSAKNAITAHAGGTQAGAIGDAAAQLPAMINRVTVCATGGDSTVLPLAAVGMSLTVANSGAASMNLFPFTGDQINALGANAAFAVAAGKTATLYCPVAGQWMAVLSA